MRPGGVAWFGRKRPWWLLLLGLVLAVFGAVVKSWGTPLFGAALVAALAFLGTEGVKFLREGRDQREHHRSLARQTTTTSVDEGRGFARVADVPAERLGVRQPLVDIGHQRRDVEGHVADLLAKRRPVLLVGRAMAGKSHVGVRVLREHYPNRPLVVVLPRELPTLLQHGLPSRSVIWLDDLERHLVVETLRPDWVDLISADDSVVLATMRRSERAAFEPVGDVRHPQEAALGRFVDVDVDATPEETARIARQIETVDARTGVERYGLGVFLGGGHLVRRRYDDAPEGHPLGRALVRTAVEWRRIGLDDIDVETLQALASASLLDERGFGLAGDTDPVAELSWARERVGGAVALLEPTGRDRVKATDFLVDHLADEPIPDAVWEAATSARTSDPSALEVSFRAYEHGRRDLAQRLWTRLADVDDPEVAAVAGFDLAVLRRQAGDADGARSALLRVAESGNEEFATRAGLSLAQMSEQAGDTDVAVDVFRRVAALGHPDHSPLAAINLGRLLQQNGDMVGAEEAWTDALRSHHPEYGAAALIALATLWADGGDVARAREALDAVAANARPAEQQRARLNRALLESRAGNRAEAVHRFTELTRTGDGESRPAALVALGGLLAEDGDDERAVQAYEEAVRTGHPTHALAARTNLAGIWLRAGDADRAERALEEVVAAAHPDESPRAELNLGAVLARRGDLDAAIRHWQQVVDTAPPSIAADAAGRLGHAHVQRGDAAAAKTAFSRVLDLGDSPFAAVAATNLGVILEAEGDVDGAARAYRRGADSADPQIRELAASLLAELERRA